MLCVAALRLLVLQVATFALAEPAGRATAPQPEMALPPSLNATLPVGAAPFTVAVKVTFAPTVDGVPEVASAVVVVTPALANATLSMKVVLSLPLVPVNVMVCVPPVAIENAMLKLVKAVLVGDTGLPTGVPSTLTWIGCTYGETQHDRCAALNDSV